MSRGTGKIQKGLLSRASSLWQSLVGSKRVSDIPQEAYDVAKKGGVQYPPVRPNKDGEVAKKVQDLKPMDISAFFPETTEKNEKGTDPEVAKGAQEFQAKLDALDKDLNEKIYQGQIEAQKEVLRKALDDKFSVNSLDEFQGEAGAKELDRMTAEIIKRIKAEEDAAKK